MPPASTARRRGGAWVSGRGDTFERALRRLSLGAVGRELDDLLPRRLRAREILLAERQHDALVQHASWCAWD